MRRGVTRLTRIISRAGGTDGSTWPVTFVTRADFFVPFPARRC